MSTAQVLILTSCITRRFHCFTDGRMAVVKTQIKRYKKSQSKELTTRRRLKRLHQWNDKSMSRALELVATDKMGINKAALECGVPSTTLKDRISGRVFHGCKMGRKAYLTYAEEELVKFLTDCSKMGYGKTKQDVTKTMEKYAVGKGLKIHKRLSNG